MIGFGQKKRKAAKMSGLACFLFLIVAFVVACSRPGIQVDYSVRGESITPTPAVKSEKPSAETPTASKANVPAAAATPPPFWGIEPFDSLGFAMDPYGEGSPQKGRIYAPLPDGSNVRIELRYRDGVGAEQVQQLSVSIKGQSLDYAFLLPDLPPQFVKLTAFWLPRDELSPQPEEVIALFGERGEKLPMPPAKLGSYGDQILMETWVLAHPNAEAAERAVQDSLEEAVGGVEAGWEEGTFTVIVSGYAAAISPAEREGLIAAAKEAALAYYPFGEEELNPAVAVLDSAGFPLASSGRLMTPLATELAGECAEAVYVAGGERYHIESCRYASGAQKMARFAAELEGYTPCRICLK